MISYPAIIKYDKSDKNYLVEFPDLPGCVTFGRTMEEAKFNAEEALSAYLESIFDRGFKVPPQKKRKGKEVYYITPEASVVVPLMLRLIREEEKLTQGDAARLLAYSYQNYQKLENIKLSNPTIKTLQKVVRMMGKRLIITVEDKEKASVK